jgi:hypothetical protein
MLIRPDVARSLEHQVFEQMRESRAARLLVLRSDVIPDREMHDGRGMIFEKNHLQPVGQRGHRVVESRRPDDRVRAAGGGKHEHRARERQRTKRVPAKHLSDYVTG